MVWVVVIIIIVLALLVAAAVAGYRLARLMLRRGSWSDLLGKNPDPPDPAASAGKSALEATPNERWEITSHDGLKLVGHFFEPPEPKNRVVIIVHGYRSTWADSYEQVDWFLGHGFGVLMPDDRGCGESGGEYMGFGYLDRFDYLRWCEECARRFPGRKILLSGCSMGGATVLSTVGERLPDEVAAMSADCGYSSGYDECLHVIRTNTKLPVQLSVAVGAAAAKVFMKVDLKHDTPAELCRRAKVPGLIFHGGADDFVPTEMAYINYENYGAETGATKELLIVDGAAHAKSYAVDPRAVEAAYERLIARSALGTAGDKPYVGAERAVER